MEKICIVRRRKGFPGAAALPANDPYQAAGRQPARMISIELTPQQAGTVLSNGYFRRLCEAGTHRIVFNLHLGATGPSKLLTPKSLSEMLQVSRATVMRLARTNAIRSCRIGRLRRFSVEDVMEYLGRDLAGGERTGLQALMPGDRRPTALLPKDEEESHVL